MKNNHTSVLKQFIQSMQNTQVLGLLLE